MLHAKILRWLMAALLAWLPGMTGAEEWPRWRGPRGDGTWQGPELPAIWPAEGLPAVWRQPVGAGYSGLSVAEGRVYLQDRVEQPHESERVLCFDAADGTPLWQHAYPVTYGNLSYGSGPRATATIHEGLVYAVGALGHVHCLQAATGEVVWSHDLAADGRAVLPEWGLAASPVIWQDLVVVHSGGQPDACYVAFNRHTGEEAWRSGGDPAGYATPILIGQGENEQLIGWTPEHVLGMSPQDGRVYWSIPYKVTYGVSIATPVFHNGMVFVTGYWEGSKAIRIGGRPEEAVLAWEDDSNMRGLMSQPLCRGEYVYSLDKTLGLTCFRLETGEKMWDDDNQMTPRDRNPQANMMWLGETDRALILNSEGELILARFTPEAYIEQSRTKIISPDPALIWAHPALAGNRIYARNDTEVICLELTPP